MTYTQFKNKWLGKGIDYDGSFGNQCVDVYRMYCKEVLKIPQSPPVKGAKNIWDTYLKEHFTRVTNTPTGVPEQGDIMIWDVGTYGHVGIVDSATQTKFVTFEQNWTELNGSGVTELRTHYYKNLLGWLKPKRSIIEDMTDEQKRILDFIKERKLTEGQIRQAADWLRDNTVANLESKIEGLKATISDQYKEMDKKNLEYGKLLEEFNILLPKYEDISEKWSKLADTPETANDLSVKELLILLINKIFKK